MRLRCFEAIFGAAGVRAAAKEAGKKEPEEENLIQCGYWS
jgi:hypothetical protein